MRVIISPSQLHVDPKFIRSRAIILLFILMQKTWFTNLPFIFGEHDEISTGAVHFVTFTGMDCLFLDSVDLESVFFHVEDLIEIDYD